MKKELEIIDIITGIVGEDDILVSDVDLACYSYDSVSRALRAFSKDFRLRADAVARPESTQEVVEIVKVANEYGVPLIPRGAGTSLAGQLLPVKGGVVLDFSKMGKIKMISTDDQCVIVEPGVEYFKLRSRLDEKGYFFPPEPGSAKVCTIGGMVANNASGSSAAKFGTTKNYVMDLEVVLASGEVIKTGARTIKSCSGYDLTSLFVGSEGTLGIITEITLRILPKPEGEVSFVASFGSIGAACDAGRRLLEKLNPSVLEFVDRTTTLGMKRYDESLKLSLAPSLIVRLSGRESTLDDQLSEAKEICGTAKKFKIYKDELQKSLWQARHSAGPILSSLSPHIKSTFTQAPATLDFAVPLSKIVESTEAIDEIVKEHNLIVLRFGHLGDGNIHHIIEIPLGSEKDLKMLREVQRVMAEKMIEFGGTMTAEHGVGLWKAPYLELEKGHSMEVMRQIKKTLDPNNILNPGKMALDGVSDMA
ncbi:MAG: FAD-binding oxidoreductase, partial [Halobacteriota archaeon]|nr:FAD-binding oxidoreductase [Halobacteriota archaeon]